MVSDPGDVCCGVPPAERVHYVEGSVFKDFIDFFFSVMSRSSTDGL